MFITRLRFGSHLLQRTRASAVTTTALFYSSRASSTTAALGSLAAMQLRARTQSTTASSAAVAIKSETTTKKKTITTRSSRAKRPSQARDSIAVKIEPPVTSATTVSRSVKRRAVALAYDDDDAVKMELKQDELGSVNAVDNVSSVTDTAKMKKTVASPQKKKRTSKTDKMRVKREQPAQWEAMLSGIQAMRAERKAEVDTMGCEVCV